MLGLLRDRRIAEDDRVDGVNQSLVYYIALKDAGVPVEMHTPKAATGSACGARICPSPDGLGSSKRG
jgi:hypothetical protein